jgi:hypothetical protein
MAATAMEMDPNSCGLNGRHPMLSALDEEKMVRQINEHAKDIATMCNMLGFVCWVIVVKPEKKQHIVSAVNTIEARIMLGSTETETVINKACNIYCGKKERNHDGEEIDDGPLSVTTYHSTEKEVKRKDRELLQLALKDLKWLYGPLSPGAKVTQKQRNRSRGPDGTVESIMNYARAGYRISPRISRMLWPVYPHCPKKIIMDKTQLLDESHLPLAHDCRLTSMKNKKKKKGAEDEREEEMRVPSRVSKLVRNIMYSHKPYLCDGRFGKGDGKRPASNQFQKGSKTPRTNSAPDAPSQLSKDTDSIID